MLHWIEAFVFFILLLLTIYAFFSPLYLRYKIITAAQPESRKDRLFKRILDAVRSFFLLTCSVKKERVFTGFVHIFLLYGSLTFDTVSINHILEGFNENWNFYGHGLIRKIHSVWADGIGIMVLLAVLYFVIRRWVVRQKNYTYPNRESVFIYLLLVTVTITFFTYEGALIAFRPEHAYSAFVGKIVSGWMAAILPVNIITVKVMWWLHIINVFVFVSYVPRSKYLHMFMGPINIAVKNYGTTGVIKPLNLEDETAEKFGVVDIKDLTWKDLLDSYACMECGRCDDYCPANQTGKPLSPKNIVLNLKWHALKNKEAILANAGTGEDNLATLEPLMASTYTPDEIWSCTTCGACMHVCPVKNEHIPKILGVRQSMTLMESNFPETLNTFYKGMETNANPWGFGASTKGEWAEGLDLKIMSENSDVDILYWVGCAGSYDERSKKVSLALVKLLKAAGVNFGILGVEEGCCGDQSRRLGNEYMFQMMAQQNIEIFTQYNIKKILVTCPHGFNTFKNEYPVLAKQLGIENWDIEIIHHSQLIGQLIEEGKLKLDKQKQESVTFHDPCYLGRHNSLYDSPRTAIKHTGARLQEMALNRDHSLCCGAGGGLMWTEENIGTRINHKRTDQALATGSDVICTSCPFCMTMLTDGIKDKEKDEDVAVKDIAELVAEIL